MATAAHRGTRSSRSELHAGHQGFLALLRLHMAEPIALFDLLCKMVALEPGRLLLGPRLFPLRVVVGNGRVVLLRVSR